MSYAYVSKSRSSSVSTSFANKKIDRNVSDFPKAAHSIEDAKLLFNFSNVAINNIQAKLKISQPGDKYEQEADQVANTVMNLPKNMQDHEQTENHNLISHYPENGKLQRKEVEEESSAPEPSVSDPSSIDRPEGEEADGVIMAKELSSHITLDQYDFAKRLSDSKHGGSQLPYNVRTFMESRFNADFRSVRIHTNAAANRLSEDINAAAFTHGPNIFFGSRSYDTDSESGRWLIAHELTHVIQQDPSYAQHAFASRSGRLPYKSSAGQLERSPFHSITENGMPWIQRRAEVHVNLREPNHVKLYHDNGSENTLTASAGQNTLPLIRPTPYSLTKRDDPTAQVGRWGLQYFAPFRGGIGFHSNICFPTMRTACAEHLGQCNPRENPDSRVRHTLIVDGNLRSHGCVRLNHGDSRTLFNAVSNGDNVFVYDRQNWRPRSF